MKKRILIVDDDEKIRTMLRITFEDAGFLVDEAADGRQALKTASANPPDLIILDLYMPNLDGFETLEQLQDVAIPVFAVSGGGPKFVPQLQAAGFLGAEQTFAKPFDRKKLLKAVEERLLNKKP